VRPNTGQVCPGRARESLLVFGPGPAPGVQEIPPKEVAAGGPKPVSKGQKQLHDWVAAGIQGGFIKPMEMSA
jgi:hypothetical protein